MKEIAILGRHDVEDLGNTGDFVWHIHQDRPYAYLSISDYPHTKVDSPLIYNKNCKGYLHMAFIDSEEENYIYKGARSIRDEQAAQIAEFVLSVWPEIELFIAQCEAGISRSAAVAKAVDEVLNGGQLDIGLPDYEPNILVYKKVKRILSNPNYFASLNLLR
ncbi:MAG: hypothetical protein LBV04_10295 [Deferribacteraceae bacterium]|jgi:hypothetical protein|nr:hypothetical protein [Deferribacteraceae bacterium]